jgi:large subunit ribosomal protein L17
MRHRKKGRKFGRKRGKRKAFMKSLAANLFLKGKIITTEARAKETAKVAAKLITLAKKGNLASLRELQKRLPRNAATKLFKEIAPKYKERHGGYTRIYKTGRRLRDGAPTAIIELME